MVISIDKQQRVFLGNDPSTSMRSAQRCARKYAIPSINLFSCARMKTFPSALRYEWMR
jgi:hypothetical protein